MSVSLPDSPAELERVRLQARVWEPAGRTVLGAIEDGLGPGAGLRVLDVGAGAIGWLRILSEWVGPEGTVVGTDISRTMLAAAASFVEESGLSNVELIEDDLFVSRLPAGSFDLVHSRFQLAGIGRMKAQLAAYRRLLTPGGILVLEEPDSGSWRIEPDAPAACRLIELIRTAFVASGGDFDAGRRLPSLLVEAGIAKPWIRASVRALPPGHPYLRLPIQLAASLQDRLVPGIVEGPALRELLDEAEDELERPATWGTTFTLLSAWGRLG